MTGLFGIRVTGGPLAKTPLPLYPGLTVLCGANGSGKSRLLVALASALTGQLRDLDGNPWKEELRVELFEQSGYGWHDPRAARCLDPEHWHDSQPHGPGLATVIAGTFEQAKESGIIALTPVGDVKPRWTSAPAVLPDQGTSAYALAVAENQLLKCLHLAAAGATQAAMHIYREQGFRYKLIEDALEDPDLLGYCDEIYDHTLLLTDDSDNVPIDGLPLTLFPSVDSFGPNPKVGVITHSNPGDVDRETGDALDRAVWLVQESEAGRALFVYDNETIWSRRLSYDSLGGDVSLQAVTVQSWLKTLGNAASRIFADLMLGGPRLWCDWSAGHGPHWLVGENDLPLSALSSTERRWATIAIRLVLRANAGSYPIPKEVSQDYLGLTVPTFLIIDEPETAVHGTAEEHLAEGLARLARQSNLSVVVASNSSHLLEQEEANVMRVWKESRRVLCFEEGASDHYWETRSTRCELVPKQRR